MERKCRVCGEPMKLLDEDEQKWYCYKEDQVWLDKEQKWVGRTVDEIEKIKLWMEGDIGWKPHVRCREKGKAFGFTWTYKDGVIDKAKCQGCGKLFEMDNDEDHIPIIISL